MRDILKKFRITRIGYQVLFEVFKLTKFKIKFFNISAVITFALYLTSCSNLENPNIDSSSLPVDSQIKINISSQDCATLITITYDVESAILELFENNEKTLAIETMNDLTPIFRRILVSNSDVLNDKAKIWLEQLVRDTSKISDEVSSTGQITDVQAKTQLIDNINRLDEFCKSEE